MTENSNTPAAPLTIHTVKTTKKYAPGTPRWKALCGDDPALDPREVERFLARLPRRAERCGNEILLDCFRRWKAAQSPPIVLWLSDTGTGLHFRFLGESCRGASSIVLLMLDVSGTEVSAIDLWPADSNMERPLFVLEASLAGPLPEGARSAAEAENLLLQRLRPAFALLHQGDVLAATACITNPNIPDVPSLPPHELLTPT